MKRILAFMILFTLVSSPKFVFSQEKVKDYFILSFLPDSLLNRYDYSRIVFVTVSVNSTFGKDPTEKAIQELQTKIIEICKINNMDGFLLNQMIFAKPFDEGKLIGYGSMLRAKPIRAK